MLTVLVISVRDRRVRHQPGLCSGFKFSLNYLARDNLLVGRKEMEGGRKGKKRNVSDEAWVKLSQALGSRNAGKVSQAPWPLRVRNELCFPP